jgi:hypothetical protein
MNRLAKAENWDFGDEPSSDDSVWWTLRSSIIIR